MPTVIEQQDRTFSGILSDGDGSQLSESTVINEAALLIEQMELDEPMKIAHAPNHLLETKAYAKVGKNDLVHAKPSVIHFDGFQIDRKHVKSLRLLNASSDVLRIHIIPPQTRNFTIKYTKLARMVPGMALECVIEFKPDEWRYYYDCVRIHCPGEDNLVIPIHGYPVMNSKEFPRNFTFKPIPIGYRVSKKFPLKSMSPVDFEFNFEYIQYHPAFKLEPMSGIVPANSKTEVTVTFAPSEFQTAIMIVKLTISQFNLQGIVCTFTGSSLPGLLKEKTLRATEFEVLDPESVSPLDRARNKKHQAIVIKHGQQKKMSSIATAPTISLEKDGIRFPAVLDSPQAVGKILMQEPGKIRASEMRQSVLNKNKINERSSQQVKEAIFEYAVRQNIHEERQNQLRWQVKVGDDPISAQERYKILEDRNTAMNHYKLKTIGDLVLEDETNRLETVCVYRRTKRDAKDLAPDDATFNVYSSDLWSVRHAALERFVQAARTIIIRNRADKRLPFLKNLVKKFNRKKKMRLSLDDSNDIFESERRKLEKSVKDVPFFRAEKIQKFRFPIYVNPDVKDDMAPDALGIVSVTPAQIGVKRDIPFFDLKVPQYYRLQGYNKHSCFIGYMPVKHSNILRTGAEDEIITIPDDVFSPCQVPVYNEREGTPVSGKQQHASLTPPSALLRPINYPSLHIINPVPGLQVFLPLVPYSEIDNDYHLCPLPRYPRTDQSTNKQAVTQKIFLNREETIKGVMSWKKFPSQGLISMSNTPTLTNVWVPRWDDCFSKDLLPDDVPPLLGRLDPDDNEQCAAENDIDSSACLQPAMVNAEFVLIDKLTVLDQKLSGEDETASITEWNMFPNGNKLPKTNLPVGMHGPVAKEQRAEDLEFFNSKKYNKLGTQFNVKIVELDAKITDPNLILKS